MIASKIPIGEPRVASHREVGTTISDIELIYTHKLLIEPSFTAMEFLGFVIYVSVELMSLKFHIYFAPFSSRLSKQTPKEKGCS